MKLSTKQAERTALRIDASTVPDHHPVVAELTKPYGDHTFFLDDDGLKIVETGEPEMPSTPATVVKLAAWANDKCTKLAPHEPQATDVVVDIDIDGDDA